MKREAFSGLTRAARRFAQMLAPAPRVQVLAMFALQLAVSLTEGVGVLLLVPLLSTLTAHPHWAPTDWIDRISGGRVVDVVLALFVLVIAARSFLQHLQQTHSARLQNEMIDALRLHCFAALQSAEWRWLSTRRTSDHTHILMSNMTRIGFGLGQMLALSASLVMLAGYVVTALVLSWRMALLACLCGALLQLLFAKQRAAALRLGDAISAASRTMQAQINEGLASIRLSKILGNEGRHVAAFGEALCGVRTQQIEFTRQSSLGRVWLHIGGAAVLVLILGAGLDIWHVALSLLLPLVFVFARIIPMLGSVQQCYYFGLSALPALDETDALLRDCAAAAEPALTDHPPLRLVEAVRFEAVSFSYAERTGAALTDLNLSFAARTTTAIIGASGAGKSTLADLLMGLLEPDTGVVRVDGVALIGATRRRWRQQVAYVEQDAFLFHDSVRNNLLWAKADATDDELAHALQTAAADFVYAMPQGLDTVVGDGGVRLSGGERQRVALARALLGAPSLLILDEATSALDPENEAAIRRAIEALHGALTVVIIGHRIAFLDRADQVIRLEAGRVAASGAAQSQSVAG